VDLSQPSFNEPKYVSFRNKLHLYGYGHRQHDMFKVNKYTTDIVSPLKFKTQISQIPIFKISDGVEYYNSKRKLSIQHQRKPIYESGEEILYPIYPLPEIDQLGNTLKGCEEIIESSAYFKEPVEPLISKEIHHPFSPLSSKPMDDHERLITCLTIPEAQVEYVFEYDDDVEDEEKVRERIIQIFCLGAIGLGIVTVSSIYVAFYLNTVDP